VRFGPFQSGLLEDVHIISDSISNSLILLAPPKTMQLLLKLIEKLDVDPIARSEINIFTLKKNDATAVANMLNQLFLGTSTGAGGVTTPGGGALGAAGAAGAGGALGAAGGGGGPLRAVGSEPLVIPVRITIETRTNSLIVAASPADLLRINAIVARLEDTPDSLPRHNQVYHLKNSTAADVATALNSLLSGVLTVLTDASQLTPTMSLEREAVVVAEPITNKLLISASPQYFGEILELIENLDAERPMVVIQVLIAEVDLDATEEFGIEVGAQSPVLFNRSIVSGGVTINSVSNIGQPGFLFGNPALPLPNSSNVGPGIVGYQGISNFGTGRVSPNNGLGGFVFQASSENFTLLIRTLKTQRRLDVLSRPQVMTLDNQFARVLIGAEVPYLTSSTVTGTGTVTGGVSYRPVGIELQVTPQINAEGRVVMRVVPTVSNVDPVPVQLGNGFSSPKFNVQTVETTVAAWDGETVAIGGLISARDEKDENKLPWFSDLPIVGSLFRYRQQLKTKQELMVILTPHVVWSRADADRIMALEARRMDWAVGDVVKYHATTGFEPLLPSYLNGPPDKPLFPGTGRDDPGHLNEPLPSPRPLTPVPAPAQPPSKPMPQQGDLTFTLPPPESPALTPPGPLPPGSEQTMEQPAPPKEKKESRKWWPFSSK
jgi:type II secretory pathway component GspD/PulD (secretin)